MDIGLAALTELASYRPLPETAGELGLGGATVGADQTNAEVMALFEGDLELDAVTVLKDEHAVGLVVRNAFYNRFARPFARELYLNKACVGLADAEALQVDAATPIAEIGQMVAVRGEAVLAQGFLVHAAGRHLGHCRGITLMRALSDLQGEQHKQLLSSIDYASTIQHALLADSRAALAQALPGRHALIWRPRDVVGGDCFFARRDGDGLLAGVIDCTGHGVPGALLTSIALSEVSRLAADPGLRTRPGALISALNERVKSALQQQSEEVDFHRSDDGMDAAFLWSPTGDAPARLASAKLPVFVLDEDGAVQTLKGERKGVGYRSTPAGFAWGEQEIERRPGRRLFLATDGLCDQIGETRAVAYGWSRFAASLQDAGRLPLPAQADAAFESFLAYQGRERRRDDLTLIGLDLEADA